MKLSGGIESVVCCRVEVSASSRSLVQGSPSVCVYVRARARARARVIDCEQVQK
jgi:hypothetical protein